MRLASSDEVKKLLDAQIAALGEQMSATPEKKPAAAPAPPTPPPTKPPSTKAASKEKAARRRSRGGRRRRARTRRARTRTTTTARRSTAPTRSGSSTRRRRRRRRSGSSPRGEAAAEARRGARLDAEAHVQAARLPIGQYKLNRVDAVLAEIADVCHAARRGASDWHVKYIQALAFCRWKQHRFKEALDLFYQQQEIVGASSALCENIGHTLSSLGDLPKAEEYFERAIELLKHGSFGNRGGIYMGLGLVRERLGKLKEALLILEQALEHYQKEHTKGHATVDSSIIAAHMSIGKVRPAQLAHLAAHPSARTLGRPPPPPCRSTRS